MSKKRIYQIAHELDVSSKEVIAAAKKNGIKVGNHMSMLDENEEQTVKKSLGKGAKSQKAQAQPAPAKKPAPKAASKPVQAKDSHNNNNKMKQNHASQN